MRHVPNKPDGWKAKFPIPFKKPEPEPEQNADPDLQKNGKSQ